VRAVPIALVLLAAGLAAAAPPAGAAAPGPPTHVAALDSVAGDVAAELLGPGAVPAGRPVEIAPPLPGDTLSLFEQQILQRLRAEGVEVRLAAPPAAPVVDPVTGETKVDAPPPAVAGLLRLGLRVEAKSVVYTRRRGRFPMGTKGYDRLVSLRAQARLVDAATGEVLWAKSGSKSAADFVRAGDADAAASGTGLFAPARPHGSGFGFLEPVLVTGVVVGLIVLFYSNRT
jgi:hypothetical protein